MNISAVNWAEYFSGNLHRFDTIDSTQAFLNTRPAGRTPLFCSARQQRSGQGQRGRIWQSPPGNLYCSLRIYTPLPLAVQAGLAQSVALTIAEALDPDAATLQLKWPNDILTACGKCGGILIDSSEYDGGTLLTIGIGLNLTNAAEQQSTLSRDLNHKYNNTDTTLDTIMPPLLQMLESWRIRPYLPTTHRWQDYDAYRQRTVTLDNHHHPATLYGIDQKGRLIARDRNGLHFLTQVRIKQPHETAH